MAARHLIVIVGAGIVSLAGCLAPVQRDVDSLVCKRSLQEMDPPSPEFLVPAKVPNQRPPIDPKKPPKLDERLEIPEGVTGSSAPKLLLPANWKTLPDNEKQALLNKLFKSQMDVGPDPRPVKGPGGNRLTLADLQKLAREHSPLLRQAASDIKGAEGAVIQAAVYNNPTLSYSTTPISYTSGNIVGPGITQTIVTMGKRKLAEAAAKKDLENAQLAYRRAETDLMAQVRSNYFAVLVSEEGMRANRGLADLTDEIYKVFVQQLKGGIVALYEPAQIGVLAGQARIAYIISRNSYLESWKLLATSMGLTMMPATELGGNIAQELPRFDFEKSLAHVLDKHTDVITALNGVDKARFLLRLAEVTGVPDFTLGAFVYNDNSSPGPPKFVPSLVATVPVPIFDRNQGNIRSAQAALMRAVEEPHRVQNALSNTFVDAYRRLEENRKILQLYRRQLLPQQVQAFRATVIRHNLVGNNDPGLAGGATAYMGDLITAEQSLVNLVGNYLTTLGAYWQAVSDTASVLQIDDVYKMATKMDELPDADLLDLLKLPCCHPCSSLQAPGGSPDCELPQGSLQPPTAIRDLDNPVPAVVSPYLPPVRVELLAPVDNGDALKGGTR